MTDLERITQSVEKRAEKICQVNDRVWEYAELAFHEFRSADTICQVLEEEGFTVERGLAGIPTCFTGTYVHGSGKPVMGILGEFDALSSLSQQAATTTPQPVVPGGAGHGCGHCSLGAGSLAAVLAIKDYLEQTGEDGTIIYFGCPAEEGAGSKQFMARAGLFDHVDFIYTWHPSNQNAVEWVQSNAIIGANFHFKGRTSHAGAAPHMGRSALDAVELMSVGCNYLREHVIPEVRIHYAYIDAGGTSPNVVQDNATVRYEIRAPFSSQLDELFERVKDVARGAALMRWRSPNMSPTARWHRWRTNVCMRSALPSGMKPTTSWQENLSTATTRKPPPSSTRRFAKNMEQTIWKRCCGTRCPPRWSRLTPAAFCWNPVQLTLATLALRHRP